MKKQVRNDKQALRKIKTMIRRTYISVIIVIMLVFAIHSCSWTGKKDKGDRPPILPETKFLSTMSDTKPFNINTDQLSPMYAGHNPELLYNTIRLRQEIVKHRPEESAEEHRSRIAGDVYAPIMGSLDFDSMYAFRINPAHRTYNAGKRSIELSLSMAPIFEKGLDGPKRAFVVRYQLQLDNSYTITEKNGSKRVVEEKKFSEYAIVPVDSRGVPVENRDKIAAAIPMMPEDARKTEGDIMFLVIGRLQSPYISYEELSRNPLPGVSGTYLARYHYLHIRVFDIWAYDAASGKILLRGLLQVPSENRK